MPLLAAEIGLEGIVVLLDRKFDHLVAQ